MSSTPATDERTPTPATCPHPWCTAHPHPPDTGTRTGTEGGQAADTEEPNG